MAKVSKKEALNLLQLEKQKQGNTFASNTNTFTKPNNFIQSPKKIIKSFSSFSSTPTSETKRSFRPITTSKTLTFKKPFTKYNKPKKTGRESFCQECKSFVSRTEIIPTKKGHVCERCYIPETPAGYDEKGRKIDNLEVLEIGEENENSSEAWNTFSQTPILSKTEKAETRWNFFDTGTAEIEYISPEKLPIGKEISREEFYRELKHEVHLTIRDAPYPFPPDYFRKMFDRWMKLLTYEAIAKYVITDRGGGKSKNAGLYLLYRVATENEKGKEFMATFVMRNYDENTKLTRPQYEGYIDYFVDSFYGEEGDKREKEKASWRLTWSTLYRAVEKDKRERIVFVDLYNPTISKKIDIPHQEIFFEESIPTQEQMLKDGGWIMHGGKVVEETNYEIIRKSASRGITNPRMTFLGNPNIPWLDIWFLIQYWEKELTEITKWYWANTPKGKDFVALQKWRAWTWTKIYQKEVPGIGKIFLYLEKTKHEHKLMASEEDWCWHNFLKTSESLNIVPFVNGSQPLYVFNGCICYWRDETKEDPMNTGYWSFISIDNPNYSNRDTVFDNIPEYCINLEQRTASFNLGLVKTRVDRDPKPFQLILSKRYEGGRIKFNDSKARQKMLLFISKGKITI